MSGSLANYGSGIPGVAPSAATQNPVVQNALAQYASLPTAQLEELAARLGGTSQGAIVQRILQQRQMLGGVAQAAQPAMRQGGIVRQHFDAGGMASVDTVPWYVRREAAPPAGLIRSPTPGRTDTINMEPLAGSYVLPADVVAGLGEDNTLAGAAVADRMFGTGPGGIPETRGVHGRGPPAPPRAPRMDSRGGAEPGAAGERVPIVAAGGEYVVAPAAVARLGNGNMKRGHDLLDAFVKEVRKRANKKRLALPPPKKN